jgi:hypothetical protein
MRWEVVKPYLDATYRLLEEDQVIDGSAVVEALGDSPDDPRVGQIFRLLQEADYINAHFAMATQAPVMIQATEKGLQATSGWPSPGNSGDLVLALISAIDDRIEDEATSDEERGRLRRWRDALVGVGTNLAAEVLASYAAKATGVSP